MKVKENSSFRIEKIKSETKYDDNFINKISYRPFDNKYICYTKKSKGFLSYPRFELMKHFLNVRNLGLISQKGLKGQIFITDKILENCRVNELMELQIEILINEKYLKLIK